MKTDQPRYFNGQESREDTCLHQHDLCSKSNKIYYVQSPKVGRKNTMRVQFSTKFYQLMVLLSLH